MVLPATPCTSRSNVATSPAYTPISARLTLQDGRSLSAASSPIWMAAQWSTALLRAAPPAVSTITSASPVSKSSSCRESILVGTPPRQSPCAFIFIILQPFMHPFTFSCYSCLPTQVMPDLIPPVVSPSRLLVRLPLNLQPTNPQPTNPQPMNRPTPPTQVLESLQLLRAWELFCLPPLSLK